MGLSRTIFVVLGVVALLATLARPAYAPDCNLPDLSSCACYLGVGPWPIGAAAVGDLLAAADLTVGTRTACFQHGGQPYWQIQRQVTLPAGAEAIAHLDPNFEVDNPPNAWCTETIARHVDAFRSDGANTASAEMQALTQVCHMLLNTSEFLYVH